MAMSCFNTRIVCSDAFLLMSFEAQALYFQLSMDCDKWGVFLSPLMTMRKMGLTNGAFDELLEKRFILPTGEGGYLIKHYLINNMVRKDRMKTCDFKDHLAHFIIKPNGAYSERPEDNDQPVVDELVANGWLTGNDGMPFGSRCGNHWYADGKPADNQVATSGIPADSQRFTMRHYNTNTNTNTNTNKYIGHAEDAWPVENPNSQSKAMENFEDFYSLYPYKRNRKAALKAWEALEPDGETYIAIMAGLSEALDSEEWNDNDGKYIPQPANWLSGRCWEDDYKPKYKPGCGPLNPSSPAYKPLSVRRAKKETQ
jgi:hypothetical protein